MIGWPVELPETLRARFPELGEVRWRRGGMFVRAGGWALFQRTAAAITLWRTVFLAPDTPWDTALLLHELRHVHHFRASRTFPLRYLLESLQRGYANNRYEADANAYARQRLLSEAASRAPQHSAQDL